MESLEVWSGDQSLHATLIDHVHDPKLRARIRRDAYDNQSLAVVEAWTTTNGWREIHSVPIERCGIHAYSYSYAIWDRDAYENGTTVNRKAGMPFWEDVIETDIQHLMEYGHAFFE